MTDKVKPEDCTHPQPIISGSSDHPGQERWFCPECGMTGIQPNTSLRTNIDLKKDKE